MENIQSSSKRLNHRELCCSSLERLSQCTNMPKKNKKTRQRVKTLLILPVMKTPGPEEKCVSPPWGVNLSSLLDPWKQTNASFSRLAKKE